MGNEGSAEIPLPIGLLALGTDARVDPTSDVFDPLTALDRGLHPFTYLFAPATSPKIVRIDVETVDGGPPRITLDLEGGSRLALFASPTVRLGQRLDLPLGGSFGAFSVAARPYAMWEASATGDGLADALASGADAVRVSASGVAEAGIAFDLSGAVPLALPGSRGDALFVGGRVSPFLGLVRAEGTATLEATVDPDTNEPTYTYEASAFESGLSGTGLGYGVGADLGVAARIALDGGGTALVGAAVNGARVAVWEGTERGWSGTEASGSATGPVNATRTIVLDDVGVFVHGAVELDAVALGLPGIDGFLVAADLATDFATAAAHAGAELRFGLGPVGAAARAGIGYDDGFVAGVGTGVELAGFGLDLALHTFRSTLTLDPAFGLSAGVALRF